MKKVVFISFVIVSLFLYFLYYFLIYPNNEVVKGETFFIVKICKPFSIRQ